MRYSIRRTLLACALIIAAVVQTAEANSPPVIGNPIADQQVGIGAAYEYVVPPETFSDPDGDPLNLDAPGLPSWLSFDAANHKIFGTAPLGCSSQYSISVTAGDPGGESCTETYTLSVINETPVVNESLPNQEFDTTTDFTFQISPTAFSDPENQSLTYSSDIKGGSPDDDGVTNWIDVRVGELGASVTVTVRNAPAGAMLDAWIDWNGDGAWGGPGEQIADRLAVTEGANAIGFNVPGWARSGRTYSRFRLSTAGDLGIGGHASDGEVEDHEVRVAAPQQGNGSFTPHLVSTLAAGASSVFAADVDGDGDMDILSASFNDDKIAWYENIGGNFTEHVVSASADGAESVFAADMDGDGDMDLLSASFNNDKIAWYENIGGNFIEHGVSASANGAKSVFAADVDGDGDMDLLSASFNDDKIAWYENKGGSFTAHAVTTSADGAASVFAANVDGDGDMDLISASSNDGRIAWYENNGSGSFTAHAVTASAAGAASVFAADMDNDGDPDLLSASFNDGKIAWYENDGGGSFTARIVAAASDGARSIFAADMDGDGDTDVLAATYYGNKILWYENDGNQVFTAHAVSTEAAGPVSVFAADVDGDGVLDALSASYGDNRIAWYGVTTYPIVSTTQPTNVTGNSATGGGQVTNLPQARSLFTVSGIGCVWNTAGMPTVESNAGMTTDTWTTIPGGMTFISSLTGLTEMTTYYARAYVTVKISLLVSQTFYGWEIPFTTEGSVPRNNALEFKGFADYVEIPDHSGLDLTANYTLECWFRADELTGMQGLISKFQTDGSNGYRLRLDGTELDFDGCLTSGLGLQTGIWHHAAAVNNNGVRTLYVDGVGVPISAGTLTVTANTDPLRLGSDAGGNFLNGQMDEVRIWNTARTRAEILYAMHRLLIGDENGLAAWYPFNLNSSDTAVDFSVNDHTGALYGSTRILSTIPWANGDIDGSGITDLRDAFIGLQILAGVTPQTPIKFGAEINSDGKIGMDEAIYILQKIAGIR